MRNLTVDSSCSISSDWWRKVTQSASSRSKHGYMGKTNWSLLRFIFTDVCDCDLSFVARRASLECKTPVSLWIVN